MTTLAVDTPRSFELGSINEVPVIAADIIYEGAAVGDNGSGYARPLVAGDPFRGFAEARADNSVGAAGDKRVRVRRYGGVVLTIASIAVTDIGKAVYASDDNTFTLTKGSNTQIGYVFAIDGTNLALVAYSEVGGLEVALTDSSGGTAADTIAAIGATYDQAEVRNAVASLAAKVNYLLGQQGN